VALQSTKRLTDFRNCTNMYRRPGRRDTNDVSEPTADQLTSLPALTLRGVRRGPAPACTQFQWRAPKLTGGGFCSSQITITRFPKRTL